MENKTKEKVPAASLGPYLAHLRSVSRLTLRQVEEATSKEVSNAYLSQLENGHITKPSPNILYSLAGVYSADYENLMERAGYIAAASARKPGAKHGRAATFAVENLSQDEEGELLKYLGYLRTKKG